jgi:hypothetical protein
MSLEGKAELIEDPKKFCNPIFIIQGECEAWADQVESLYVKG